MGMNRRRAALQAYLAGIVDGEGSFGIYDLHSWQARLCINMQDPEALLFFKRCYPEGSFAIYQKAGKTVYCVLYSQHRAYQIIRELLPFLLIKHRQAKIVLSFLVHRRRSHRKANQGVRDCPRCVRLAAAVKQVRGETKGVNSVNALSAHGLRQYRAKRADVDDDIRVMLSLLEGVETRDRATTPVEPMSAPEQEIVQASA